MNGNERLELTYSGDSRLAEYFKKMNLKFKIPFHIAWPYIKFHFKLSFVNHELIQIT